MYADREPRGRGAPPCAACSKPSECELWTIPVCYECYGTWHREAAQRFTHGDKPTDPEVYEAFAKSWVASRKVAK